MSESNGQPKTKATITLEYNLLTGDLVVGGDAPNVSISINMLNQALREFDAVERISRAMKLQAQQREQAENKRIADIVTKRG